MNQESGYGMSDLNSHPYVKRLRERAAGPQEELSYVARKRKIPQATLPMHSCPLCFALTVGIFICFILTILSFSWHILNVLVLFGISAGGIALLVSHLKAHLQFGGAELTGLRSSSMVPTEVVNHIERWISTHPMTIDTVETPWRSIKSINDSSHGRVSASLVIPIQCQTLINGVSPTIERELQLTVDAAMASSGGTDVTVTVQFTAIDQDQCNQTIAAVVGSIVTGVVMQDVLQIGGSRTPVRWCFPEPVWSRDDVRFRTSVQGALIVSPTNDADLEQRLEHVLREIQTLVSIVANEMDSGVLRTAPESLRAAAASRIREMSFGYDCAFELEDIQVEELEKLELPMPIKERPNISLLNTNDL